MRPRKSSRKVVPPPPDVAELIKRISDAPDNELVNVLRPIRVWRYLRGDMHAWVPVTKQFVRILSTFGDNYGFGAGSSKQCKLQLNEFTPKDKELILEILRFIRLLMENCTSRKLFQGYEVINDLLLTSDLDVLEATIFVLLRPLQQYLSNMPTSPELSNSIRQRLLALTRGWDTLPLAQIDLVKYASSTEPLDGLENVPNLQLQFYPASGINSTGSAAETSPTKTSPSMSSQAVLETPTRPSLVSQRSEHRVAGTPLAPKIPPVVVETTMVTVDLEPIAKMSGDYIDKLATIADDNQMDIDDQLLAMSKIRVVRFAKDVEARRKLLTCRLMALACYIIFSSEDAVQSTILLYEPELVNQVSELLVPGRDVPDSVVASAVLALDSMSRHRPAEVLTTISAHVSHGIIMNLLRSIANKLSSGEEVEHNLVDAIFGFVSNINALPTHGTLLVGAGLMPVLLELLDTKGDRRLQYISRACGLIDSALYNHPQALPAFTNADGLNIMVNKVKAEVKTIVDAPLPGPTELESRDTIISFDTQALKAELRSIYRMLQSTGGAEGFRNVVDTDLPKSIKAIFLNMDKFGERNFVLATNIMATIIHNEPTSLGILQEMNLPQTFYDVLDKYMSGSFEVIYALPNAIGAICLNPAGQQATVDHFGVIKKLISATVALKPESHERDYVAAIGSSLDELARHHPLLRPKVLETVLDILKTAVAEGQDFHPSPSERNEYAVEPAENESSEMDVEVPAPLSPSAETSNPPLSKISNILKLLTGVLRNAGMCRDFIKDGGLDLVLSIADLPCVPVRFSTTEAAITIPSVLRTIGEHDQIQLTERLVAAAKQDLEALPDLWRDENARANWWALLNENGSAEDNRRFRRAAGFAMRLSFLSEYLAINLGMHRTSTQLIKTLGVSSGSDFVPNLGLLHRVMLQEHSIMKHFNMFNKPPAAPVVDGVIATQSSPPDQTADLSGPDASIVNPAIRVVEAGSEVAPDAEKKQPPTRASTVKTLVIRLHAILTKFFKASIRLIFNKRIPESAHKAEALALANCISDIIIGHLTCSAQVPQFALTIDTVALGLSTILLFDERGSEGHLSTTLFIPFDKKGGLTTMLATVRRIVAAMDHLPLDHLPSGESEQSAAQRDAAAGCQAGVRIVVAVLNALSSPRSLLESPQTHVIEAREAAYPANKRFSPVTAFVRIRRDIFPIAHHIWNAPWLPFMPQPILRMAIGTFLDIMAGKNEQLHPSRAAVPDLTSTASLPPPIPRPQVVADPARVNQLIDMGFGRHAAERALLRARNNIPAAADLLLSMPHLFPNEEPVTPAADPANEPAASDAEVTTETTGPEPMASGGSAEPAEGVEEPSTPPAAPGSSAPAEPSTTNDSASAPANVVNETNEAAMDVDPAPSPNTVWESQRAELAKLRDPCKDQLATRAMELLDQAEDLVFDLLPAFPSGVTGAEFIIGHIDQVIKESPRREAAISSRLRLLAVFARSSQLIELSNKQSQDAMRILMSLEVTMDPRPKWLSAYFLAIESVLLMTYTMENITIATNKDDPIPAAKSLIKTVDFGAMPDTLIKTAMETLQCKDPTGQETMSALRILVILTRHHPKRCSPAVIDTVFTAFKTAGPNLTGCHPLVAMIARHAFDEKADLRDIMRREIREWMNPERNKVVDISHFVRQLRQAAYRDADTFVEAVQEECELVSSDPPTSIYHVRNIHSPLKDQGEDKAKEDKKDAEKEQGGAAHPVSADPFRSSGVDTFTTNPTMDFLVSELGSAMRTIQKDEAAFRTGTPFPEETSNAYTYAGLVLSIITELVGSYFSAKKAFMAALRHGTLYGGGKSKSGFAVIINDMTCCITLADVHEKVRGTNGSNELRRLALSNWASCLIIALCANITPTYDIKDLPEDLVVVRKVVLEGIAKALKDSSTATPDPSARYGRLYALGELIYGLLTTTLSIVPRPSDDSRLHLAKTMLEKNFVSLMTSAVSEIDLNYPDIRNVLVALLRALEHLTKISIKWGRTDSKPTGQTEEADEDESDVSEEDSDISMSEEEEDEAPDLYRNSALGILGGDIDIEDEDDDMDDDDMDDEDDLLEAFGDEMDHDMVDDDDGTEPSSDEDDDDDEDDEDDGMEGEWETEDENEVEEDEHPDINIDDAFDDLEDPPVPWDEDGMMEGEEMGDEEFDTEGDDEDEDFLEHEFSMPFDMDDDGEALNDYYDDGDLFDEDDPLRVAPGIHPGSSGDRGGTGFWGWREPTARSGDPTGRSNDPATSLFGLPPRSQNDNNQHPLLSGAGTPNIPGRSTANPFGSLTSLNDLMNSVEVFGGSEAVHFLEQIVQQRRHSGAENLRVDLAQHQDGSFGLSIGGRTLRVTPRSVNPALVTPESLQAEFQPRPTMPRWQDEQAIFPYVATEQVTHVANDIVNRLLPNARVRDKAEADKKAQEEEAKKKKEQEEAEAAAALAVEAETGPEPSSDARAQDDDVEMATEDEEGSHVSDAEDEAAVEPTGPRVTIMIHGEEVDITDTGIDLEFLQALPEDMRAEVVEGQLREQNRLTQPPATNAPASSSQINPEFLSALPPELRAEVIMQETLDQARRQQDEPQDAIVPAGRGIAVDAMNDLADGLVDEINDLMTDSRGLMEILRNPSGRLFDHPGSTSRANPQTRPKREAIQLLEKPGIASLVRLLFFPEAIRKTYLFRILGHLCENTKTRIDLLNLLLSIVQDGSGDLLAVDRSFQQMSLKAISTPKATTTPRGKALDTPAPLPVVNSLFTHLQSDHIPAFIAQRCFDALHYIVTANQQAVTYFLTEHEQPVGLRKLPSKKGKGKEKYLPQTKFPIVILIGLFDRPALLRTPGMMESLTGVLAIITKPLANLNKESDDMPAASESAPAVPAPNAAATGNTTTSAVEISTTPAAGVQTSTSSGEPAPTKETSTNSATLKAPLIPPSVLRLVVNGLTIGDCTSRTFSQTITILQNLSCIPDAKSILVQELFTRAQQLGTVIQGELKELAGCLEVKDVEISPTTIVKFSPASSSQAQLLRILKTIDFLHSRKADGEMNKDRQSTKDEEAAGEIYRSFDFTNMWKQLGDCLTLAEEREATEQISAVLLPLVEALMVVCKYTHAASQLDPSKSPLLSPTTPPPTDLFFAFTTTHRKVLNAIVRNNPSLMNGSFSLLIANSRVLEFDNKRNWFFLKLKRKREALSYGSLHMNVRRQYVFQDSYSALLHRPGDEVKYGKINVKFINEDGIDAGGVTREWYHVLAQQIFDPNFALFEPCAADKQTYQPNKHSFVVDDHLSFFKFVGRVIGKAIFDGRLLDAYFSRAFYKQILGRSVDMRDLESVDPEFHKSLQWMLDNDITDIIDQEFTIEDDSFGEKKVVELKPGGAKITVTEENKAEYVRLVCAYRMENSIKEQMNSFLTGFYEIIPRHLIQIFEPDQLELLISGMSQIDVDELKNATQLVGLKSSDTDVSWFWRALRSFSQEERARFLMFVTSSSRVPLGGFSQLQGASGIQPFQIQRLYGKEGILPQASTCFNLLLLPKYSSYEQLRERLLFAVTETSGFGKA